MKSKNFVLKSIGVFALCAALLSPAAGVSAKVPTPSSKATGTVGYTAYSTMARTLSFDAHVVAPTCSTTTSPWVLASSFVASFEYQSGIYPHDVNITSQDAAGNIQGNGGNPAGQPHTYTWVIDSGTATGTMVSFTAHYTASSDAVTPLTTMNVTGTIAPNGSITGTWTDNYQGGSRAGTFTAPAGSASQTTTVTCSTGKGTVLYSDASGTSYEVTVQYAKAMGNEAWFAGRVSSSTVPSYVGNWLFAKVQDNGEPGKNVDKVWGSFTTEAAAKAGVEAMSTPTDGPFTITSGNLQVK